MKFEKQTGECGLDPVLQAEPKNAENSPTLVADSHRSGGNALRWWSALLFLQHGRAFGSGFRTGALHSPFAPTNHGAGSKVKSFGSAGQQIAVKKKLSTIYLNNYLQLVGTCII